MRFSTCSLRSDGTANAAATQDASVNRKVSMIKKKSKYTSMYSKCKYKKEIPIQMCEFQASSEFNVLTMYNPWSHSEGFLKI